MEWDKTGGESMGPISVAVDILKNFFLSSPTPATLTLWKQPTSGSSAVSVPELPGDVASLKLRLLVIVDENNGGGGEGARKTCRVVVWKNRISMEPRDSSFGSKGVGWELGDATSTTAKNKQNKDKKEATLFAVE